MIAFVDCLSCVGDGGIALIANTGCAIKDWNNTFKQIKSEKSIVPNPHCDIYEKTASIGLMTNYGKVLNQKAETSVKPDLWASTVSTCKKIVFPATIVVDTITSDSITQPSLSKNKAKYCYENCATDKRKQNCRAVVQELSKTVPGYSKCLNHCDYPVSLEVGIRNCISYCCYDQSCYDQAIDLWGGY